MSLGYLSTAFCTTWELECIRIIRDCENIATLHFDNEVMRENRARLSSVLSSLQDSFNLPTVNQHREIKCNTLITTRHESISCKHGQVSEKLVQIFTFTLLLTLLDLYHMFGGSQHIEAIGNDNDLQEKKIPSSELS